MRERSADRLRERPCPSMRRRARHIDPALAPRSSSGPAANPAASEAGHMTAPVLSTHRSSSTLTRRGHPHMTDAILWLQRTFCADHTAGIPGPPLLGSGVELRMSHLVLLPAGLAGSRVPRSATEGVQHQIGIREDRGRRTSSVRHAATGASGYLSFGYLLRRVRQLAPWPEQGQRDLLYLPLMEAIERVQEPGAG